MYTYYCLPIVADAASYSSRLVESTWKSALSALEKDHQLLRTDYLQLVDTLGRFLANCSTKMAVVTATTAAACESNNRSTGPFTGIAVSAYMTHYCMLYPSTGVNNS